MALTIDRGAAARRLSNEEFFSWARQQTVFLSSVMGELANERKAVASALESLGINVRWFEDLGGRDDGAEEAYLGEVASSTLYLGLLGDSYGTMVTQGKYKGYGATHAEYLEAKERGKRISFWERQPDDQRDGHARQFLAEVWVWQVTGRFDGVEDLPAKVEKRLREIAAEDLAPWVKVGDIIVRATEIQTSPGHVRLRALVYDDAAVHALTALGGSGAGWQGRDVQVTTARQSGSGRVESVEATNTSGAFTDIELTAKVGWGEGRGGSMDAGTAGYSPDDLTEVGLKAGLFGEPLPSELGMMHFMAPSDDPLQELKGIQLSPEVTQSVARLLVVESLVGGRRASAIEGFRLGPERAGERHLELAWREPQRYTNREPGHRSIEGICHWS